MRDPAQWSQVLIFFGILLLYSANLRNMSFPLHMPFYKNLTTFLNLSASSMTLATICSRFVFPLISLEGQRFWILGLAPISRKQVLMSKFYFAVGGTAALSLPLVLMSNLSLESSPLVFCDAVVACGLDSIESQRHERRPGRALSQFSRTQSGQNRLWIWRHLDADSCRFCVVVSERR